MKAYAKRSFWTRIVMVLAILCMSFGFMACDALGGLTRSVTKDDFESEQIINGNTVTVTIVAKNDIDDFKLKLTCEGAERILDFGDMKTGDEKTQSATFNVIGYGATVYIDVESGTCKLLK